MEENGKTTGIGTEIVRATLEKAGIKADIRLYPLARAFHMVKNEPNTLLFTLVKSPEREPLLKFRIRSAKILFRDRTGGAESALRHAENRFALFSHSGNIMRKKIFALRTKIYRERIEPDYRNICSGW